MAIVGEQQNAAEGGDRDGAEADLDAASILGSLPVEMLDAALLPILQAVALARMCQERWSEANEMLEGTAQDKIQSAKLSSEAVKWERLAIEIKDRLSSRKHLREAMAHELAMSGQRGPN